MCIICAWTCVVDLRSTKLPYPVLLIFVTPPLENKTKTSHRQRFHGPRSRLYVVFGAIV